ncbi:TetR/AcrR family transcriptional regulator [Nocardia sp. alder85J]|uniref:TetR/AcrR family transcriptional regulator n=1 Tax=Nocardia sp. alder85J TaxID=2862949 RepID=UPI001CD6D9DA|nr:TetR/AcrR family transcriptional regulator [Nocardia sp. alder85J]MCX4091492.1 TetR/AcrR family transcriptional regulator [Nocardia sp. alder85J]
MTDSVPVRVGKRERLADAAARVFHEQGVEKTTIADIARVAEVPVGNVYYYFKTKDQLIQAAIGAHARTAREVLAELERYETPAQRLQALVRGWVEQRETAVRFGCPSGTLATELDKRADGLDEELAAVMRELLGWIEAQFAAMGRADARELAVALLASYQGISLLTNTFRDPGLMEAEGRRLVAWIDSLEAVTSRTADR